MTTNLPEQISSEDEAKAFLKALYDNGEDFHPEDDPHDIIHLPTNAPLFTEKEADKVQKLMEEVYALEGFDPCGFLLHLDPDYGYWYVTDKRDGTYWCGGTNPWSKNQENAMQYDKGELEVFLKSMVSRPEYEFLHPEKAPL